MEPTKKAIDKKYDLLSESLLTKHSFTVNDAVDIWHAKKSSAYWDLHQLVDSKKIERIQHGVYSLKKSEKAKTLIPSGLAEQIHAILQESEFQYYISGIDVLLSYMQHIPDQYPILLFADKHANEEIANILVNNGINVVTSTESKTARDFLGRNRFEKLAILYKTQNFDFAENGYASHEKAFVDLYFEISRRSYPLSLQELGRIYIDMEDQGMILRGKLLRAAHERNIRSDLVFVSDADKIHPSAIKLAEIIRSKE